MSGVMLGVICGAVFGALSAGSMFPLTMENKRAAIAAAFINRFAIGLVIPVSALPLAWPLTGLLIGTLFSLPEAIITKAYAPIMVFGVLGGVAIGFVAQVVLG
ncbi:hypothetical protein [Demequina sp.]|uniref:hypothetical protein n=1 Tax=Demequina sp. TaxID=2050685 RepID=UPI0025C1B0C3|nr:hypothetical protein [Demequina sp.]